jgi:membrane protease YdiL (CAAX protease family)
MLAAIAGAWAAAYAARDFRAQTFRELVLCLATAGVAGTAIMALGENLQLTWPKVIVGLAAFLEYVPAMFVLEEVWFRGVLDSHLHRPGEPCGLWSAVFVSALWGRWHYPIVGGPLRLRDSLPVVGQLLLIHVPIGTLLSWSWRRNGNLLVPGIAHALIDAARNVFAGIPS